MTAPTFEATTGAWTWEVDQVGPQALPFQIALADGTHPDITAWTWQAEVWTAPFDQGGTHVVTCTVDGLDASGNGVVRISDADAVKLETGQVLELVQLTPTKQPWMRASLAVNLRVKGA